MKILFLGYTVEYNRAEELFGASIAGNKMQLNVLRGFAQNRSIELAVITVYPIAAYPYNKKICIKRKWMSIDEEIIALRVPFLNFPIIKQLFQMVGVYHEGKNLVDKDTIVFIYNPFPQVGNPAIRLKKKYGCHVCVLFADPPIEDISIRKNKIKNFLYKLFEKSAIANIHQCDSLIVLNERAAHIYAPEKPYIIVEGGIEDSAITNIEKRMKTKKNIVYSGALMEYSGILTMIDAMDSVDDRDVYLEIYGDGNLLSEVEERARHHKNVYYKGKVSNEKMIRIQRDAYLLVNPRPIENAIAQYTFPSKMFEYMVSGTPILTTKLNGLTEEFLECLYVTDKDDAFGLADKINMIMRLPQEVLQQKAQKAYEFIIREKCWSKQNERIYQFLEKQSQNNREIEMKT